MPPSIEKNKRVQEIRKDLALNGPSVDLNYVLAQFIDENERLRKQVAHLKSVMCSSA